MQSGGNLLKSLLQNFWLLQRSLWEISHLYWHKIVKEVNTLLLNQSCIFHNVREVTAKEVVISRERNKTGSANQSSMDSLVCVTPPHLATAATSVVAGN